MNGGKKDCQECQGTGSICAGCYICDEGSYHTMCDSYYRDCECVESKKDTKLRATRMTDRLLPGAKHPMNQPTPSMQAISMFQWLQGNYDNLKEGLITPKRFLELLDETSFIEETKVLSKFLNNNKWPPHLS